MIRAFLTSSQKRQIQGLASSFIHWLGDLLRLDLLEVAHQYEGVRESWEPEKSGERFFVETILPSLVKAQRRPVFFDVGANQGQYSTLLHGRFPSAEIYLFEPQEKLYSQLREIFPTLKCQNIALSNVSGPGTLFVPQNSVKATTSEVVAGSRSLRGAHATVEISRASLSDFVAEHQVDRIDLLKIDVEGHELEVVRGAKEFVAEGRVAAVQFEFNECSAACGHLLKDFYDALPGFRFYRLLPDGLLALNEHSWRNEIFLQQNILAISSAVSDLDCKIGKWVKRRWLSTGT